MRIRLKGINSKRKRLADGSFRTYYWAWKGGPPLRGEPGTPEFIASYNAAVAKKVTPPDGVLLNLLQGYQASDNFRSRRDRTRHDYVQQIKRIERDLGRLPVVGAHRSPHPPFCLQRHQPAQVPQPAETRASHRAARQ
jgi:hypothetical protein